MEKFKIEYSGFEPSPVDFEDLIYNTKDAKLYNVGLWEEDANMNFYVNSQEADSSFIMPPRYEKKIIIKSRRLEDFINQKVKLLKLEAEGAEPEILKGIGDKLYLIEYITADLGFERGIKQESTLPIVTNYLLKNNFEMIGLNKGRVCALYKNQSVIT